MLRIALVGRNKAAKTWVGRHLWEKHNFEHKQLGDPVSRFVSNTHWYLKRGRNKALNWEQKLSLYDFLYKIDNEIWVKYMEARLEKQIKDLVVSDVRYINELEFLRDKLGFQIVRVDAPPPKLIHVTRALGKDASPGTLYLADLYAKDFTEKIGVNYNIHFDTKNRQPTKDILAMLVKQWRENVDN